MLACLLSLSNKLVSIVLGLLKLAEEDSVGSNGHLELQHTHFDCLQNDETFKRQLAAADASRLHTVVDNKLGVAARMELDFGDRMYGLTVN